MQKVTSRISDQQAKWYADKFRSLTGGITYVTASFPQLYKRTLHYLKSKFSRGELMLMIDTFNATALTGEIAGQHLELSVFDAINLDGLDQKWEIDKDEFLHKIKALSFLDCACLEIWANGFWYGGEGADSRDIEKYVAQLSIEGQQPE